jgi:hypothetical protein
LRVNSGRAFCPHDLGIDLCSLDVGVLMLGFGLAVFLVAERVGQVTGAAWWEERLREARRPTPLSLSP